MLRAARVQVLASTSVRCATDTCGRAVTFASPAGPDYLLDMLTEAGWLIVAADQDPVTDDVHVTGHCGEHAAAAASVPSPA